MGFLRFVIGGFLILGSIIFGIMLFTGAAIIEAFGSTDGVSGMLIFWGIIDFIAFLGGLYLVSRH